MVDERYLTLRVDRGKEIYGVRIPYDASDGRDVAQIKDIQRLAERKGARVLYDGPSREESKRLTEGMKTLADFVSEVLIPD